MGMFSGWRTASEASRDRKKGVQGAPRSVLASAMPLAGPDGEAVWKARSGDTTWQRAAWYFYDAVGEGRFAFNLIANAVSRAVPFAAEIDPETGQVGDATEDPRVQAAATALLGGHEDRAQVQSLASLQWQVAGETFMLITPRPGDSDRWVALSEKGVRVQGRNWKWKDPNTGLWTDLSPTKDRLIRIWSPHPDEQSHADAATRAALPIFTEIEKTTQAIAALMDSRIAGAGLIFLPQEIDFPVAEGEQANAQTFMKLMLEAMEASIANPGSAAGRVPIAAQIPGELVGQVQHLDLATAMDAVYTQIRDSAVERLGRTLDMPREVALGQTSEANHWSGWLVDESTYKLHLEPFLLKFGAALTREYFRPVLRKMGVDRPERFVIDWNISELVARPDESEKLTALNERALISDDWYLLQLGIPDDARPDKNEVQLKRLERVVIGAPTLAADAEVANRLFGFEVAPAAAGVSGASGEEAPLEAATEPTVRALPSSSQSTAEPDEGLVAAAELVVFDALSRAGGRLLTRQYRGQFGSTPKHELHTVIHPGTDRARLLEGSFQFVDHVAAAFGRDPEALRADIVDYVNGRLDLREPHDRQRLRQYLGAS